ncbi:hypothetical protein DFH09DRAFT_1318182 [Mycena vulgaris]|nr:hypothetical protein DFH09DRAFT_1318182 [Mycena vulgaris]
MMVVQLESLGPPALLAWPWRPIVGYHPGLIVELLCAHLDNASLIFAGKQWRAMPAYYLYDAVTQDVYRFSQVEGQIVGSAEHFIERANWNNMTCLGSLREISPFRGRLPYTPTSAFDQFLQEPFTQRAGMTNLGELIEIEVPPAVPEESNTSGTPFHLRDLQNSQALSWVSEPRCAIPDTHLPAPWSCDWPCWYGWSHGPEPLQDDLRRQYNIAGPLNPIMFCHDLVTIVESRGTFYLGKRNLLAITRPEGTWSFQPRQGWADGSVLVQHPPHMAAWPAILDAQLPAPFSCAWNDFGPTKKWYSMDLELADTQEELRRCWDVPGLTPVMCMAHTPWDDIRKLTIPTALRSGET